MEIIRNYREYLKGFNVTYKETDLFIKAEKELKPEAVKSIVKHRAVIENYILTFPEFKNSLEPVKIFENDPEIIKDMKIAANLAGVGPFAAVAGAIAEKVACDLAKYSENIIVENGGDIFLKGKADRIVKIYSKILQNLALKINRNDLPLAVCSSSAKIGHSYSMGNADLVTVISKKCSIADAFATALCNNVKTISDIDKSINKFKKNNEIIGALIIFKNKIAGWGKLNIVKLDK